MSNKSSSSTTSIPDQQQQQQSPSSGIKFYPKKKLSDSSLSHHKLKHSNSKWVSTCVFVFFSWFHLKYDLIWKEVIFTAHFIIFRTFEIWNVSISDEAGRAEATRVRLPKIDQNRRRKSPIDDKEKVQEEWKGGGGPIILSRRARRVRVTTGNSLAPVRTPTMNSRLLRCILNLAFAILLFHSLIDSTLI